MSLAAPLRDLSAPDGPSRLAGRERGAVSVELVILLPVLMMVLGVLFAGWRLWSARTEVADAAAAAARAATLESSGQAAQARARAVADADLVAVGVRCEPAQVLPDVSGFASSPGTDAQVTVTVSCVVGLTDLLAPGLPGHWRVTATRSHQMDTFRERRP